MISVMLRFRVDDYGRWVAIFASRDALRREAGCLGRRVWREAGDPDRIVVMLDWNERGRYEAFAQAGVVQTPEGRARGGIAGEPEIVILEEAGQVPAWAE